MVLSAHDMVHFLKIKKKKKIYQNYVGASTINKPN